jgi:hypothetical protein
MKPRTIAVIYFVLAILMAGTDTVQAQCVGCTWIEVSPTGQTLICTILRTGATYCEVQAP